MLQLHLCDQQFNCLLKCVLYYRLDGNHDSGSANLHYNDAIMSAMASQITSPTIAYSTAYSGADQRKNQIFASLAFVRGNSTVTGDFPHKGTVPRKMFPFDDVIICVSERGPYNQIRNEKLRFSNRKPDQIYVGTSALMLRFIDSRKVSRLLWPQHVCLYWIHVDDILPRGNCNNDSTDTTWFKAWSLIYQYGLILIPVWIRNYIHYKMSEKNTHPLLNFNGETVEVWEWISNCIIFFTGHVITYPWWD